MTTLSVLDAAREAPGALAIVDGERRIRYRELAERVRARLEAWSALAQDQSEAEASLVAVQTDEGLPTVEALLALIHLQRPFLPLHSRLTAPEREQLLDSLPVRWLLTPASGDFQVEMRRHSRPERDSPVFRVAPPLAALATSGSSGAPRVAVLSRRAVMASARASARNLGWHAEDRWLLCLPLAHVGGLSVLTRCLLARRPVVLMPPRPGTSSERLALAMREGRASLISLVPAQLHGLLELEPRLELPRSVRALLTGGAAASGRLLDACAERGWPVLTSYGLTEACSQVATQRPGTLNRGQLGAGPPLPGVGVRLDDGVICISGPTLFSGYIGGSNPDVLTGPELRTRDLGRFDADGNLHVVGRIDDLIITGGENVAPWEVEAVLESCPGVLEACVFGVEDVRWGQLVAAALRTSAPREGLVEAVHAESQRRLAAFKRPRLYACTSTFVHGRTGKLDRVATARALAAALLPVPS